MKKIKREYIKPEIMSEEVFESTVLLKTCGYYPGNGNQLPICSATDNKTPNN